MLLAAPACGAPDGLDGTTAAVAQPAVTFLQQQNPVAGDANLGNRFGGSVAVDGDTALIGATGGSNPSGSPGAAYVWVRNGTTWSEQKKLTADDGADVDILGFSAALSGDTAVVGAPRHDTGGDVDRGAVYVFVRSGTVWSQQQKLIVDDGERLRRFRHGAIDDPKGVETTPAPQRRVALSNRHAAVREVPLFLSAWGRCVGRPDRPRKPLTAHDIYEERGVAERLRAAVDQIVPIAEEADEILLDISRMFRIVRLVYYDHPVVLGFVLLFPTSLGTRRATDDEVNVLDQSCHAAPEFYAPLMWAATRRSVSNRSERRHVWR